MMWIRICSLLLIALLAGCASTSGRHDGSTEAAARVSAKARSLVGVPYRWGGEHPKTGFDCSGLIVYVYDQAIGMKLPRTTAEMIRMNRPRPARNQLREGDLVFFATKGRGKVSHAGIYLGDRRFIHAPRSGAVVRIESIDTSYWGPRYIGARRVLVD